jgi:hypothetical protein
MENNEPQKPALTDAAGKPQMTGKSYKEQLAMKDENAGNRIKDLSDKVGGIIAFASVAIGFIILANKNGVKNLFVAILIICVGLFATYVVTRVLSSYGDEVNAISRQLKYEKKLAEQKAAEQRRLEQESSEAGQSAAASAAEKPVVPAAEAETESRSPAADNPDNQAEAAGGSKEKAAPLLGKLDLKIRRLSHFAERSPNGIICPICGALQDSSRDNCVSCVSEFVFDNEQEEDDIPEFYLRK